ncbi:hypothetical protein GLAREA_11753 [Glarea lozoyensis ATCC 20868]|uniref:2EXR domain-containing protein n=1 Tax=Glarea lozoyensis (strain ATCC 20868 / MF5171) TaxID=1116229 RepID=S3CF95_GLAL2|nr:uncharacterized protein GLAREA_11753 [Glarea lozoyensis ATCC 20868]EPE25172.1 hypothetical protein GLAREA_11753 [Glarea lozoyensis ATCC 20868]
MDHDDNHTGDDSPLSSEEVLADDLSNSLTAISILSDPFSSSQKVPADRSDLITSAPSDHQPSEGSQELDEFHLFPELSPELRTMIWRYTFPGPQKVNIHHGTKVTYDTQKGKGLDEGVDSTEFPIALQINAESRAETLKHYILIHRDNYEQVVDLKGNPDVTLQSRPTLQSRVDLATHKVATGSHQALGNHFAYAKLVETLLSYRPYDLYLPIVVKLLGNSRVKEENPFRLG